MTTPLCVVVHLGVGAGVGVGAGAGAGVGVVADGVGAVGAAV